jgi:hypothetical protein
MERLDGMEANLGGWIDVLQEMLGDVHIMAIRVPYFLILSIVVK